MSDEMNGPAELDGAENLISEEAAAQHFGKSRQWLRNLRLDGEGPVYVDLGNQIAYYPSDLKDWLQSRRKTPQKVQRKKPAKRAAASGKSNNGAKAAPKASTTPTEK